MGLMAARVAQTMARPAMQATAAGVGVAAVGTGIVLGTQFGYGDDFSSAPTAPRWQNHGVGGVGALATVGGLADFKRSYGPKLLGVGLGAVAGAYLLAPVARQLIAD
jgi:hypothetical protein